MDRLTALLSRFDRRTAVAMLNAEGVLRDIPPEVSGVVDRALYFNRMTGGAFDMTVQPVVDLFRERVGKEKSIPTDDEIRKALCLVDSGMIEKQGRTLRFKRPGMGITLDGIAKGFIVDRASTVLARKGITDHLINAGGDIRSMGAHPDKTPWSIGIEDPGKKGNYPDVIRMKNGAVATSGNYEVYFDHEKMFHHIVDPKTGLSPELSTSVSVRAATAMDADALATSVFVMRPGKGTAFINSLAGCECLTITRRGTKRKSSGWGNQAI
jgi:thiamine biosynthesis lipoprotein